jgi:hypothetical protein
MGFGFRISEDGEPDVRGEWSSALEVFACKIDLFSYDEICVGLRFSQDGAHWWVGESYVGYQDFLGRLSLQFPGIRTDWFAQVAHPAFKSNRTTLWGTVLTDPFASQQL